MTNSESITVRRWIPLAGVNFIVSCVELSLFEAVQALFCEQTFIGISHAE
jgi:hypothetical protein